jgi:hypothetical protein
MVEGGVVSIERQCSLWVKSVHSALRKRCPPRKRTFAVQLAMSAMGHKRTFMHAFLEPEDTARRHTSRSHNSRPPWA